VLSVDHGRVVEVPLLAVHRNPARHHYVVHVRLENGSVLEISAPHPTADGRTFGDLRTDDVLGGVRIERVTVVPYESPFTYDILPASDSGTYYAGGVLIGSTLGGAALSSGQEDYATMSLPETQR
jgi:ribosomal protein S8E